MFVIFNGFPLNICISDLWNMEYGYTLELSVLWDYVCFFELTLIWMSETGVLGSLIWLIDGSYLTFLGKRTIKYHKCNSVSKWDVVKPFISLWNFRKYFHAYGRLFVWTIEKIIFLRFFQLVSNVFPISRSFEVSHRLKQQQINRTNI